MKFHLWPPNAGQSHRFSSKKMHHIILTTHRIPPQFFPSILAQNCLVPVMFEHFDARSGPCLIRKNAFRIGAPFPHPCLDLQSRGAKPFFWCKFLSGLCRQEACVQWSTSMFFVVCYLCNFFEKQIPFLYICVHRAHGNIIDWVYKRAGIKYTYAAHLRDTGTVSPSTHS
jgi:hypothetical protein